MPELPSDPTARRALLIEAFADGPLCGNGAAVVELQEAASPEWMQALAGSLKQSETAFLWLNPRQQWCIRWFTPTCEVPLCGHATLAATLALQHWDLVPAGEELRLASRSGGLAVRVDQQVRGAASLVLPSEPLIHEQAPTYLRQVLDSDVLGYWRSNLGYRVVLVGSELVLRELRGLSERLEGADRHGLVVMQAGSSAELFGHTCDYQLRFFAPGLGIEEDPVTGSAHALVAPWWAAELGKSTLHGWQPSARCGGMRCELQEGYRVRLSGLGHVLWSGTVTAGPPGHVPGDWSVCSQD